MKTFIAILSVTLVFLAASQGGLPPPTNGNMSCPTGCAFCSTWPGPSNMNNITNCASCMTGYNANAPQKCAAINITNCTAVSINGTVTTCVQCAPGFYLSSGACTACANNKTVACNSSTALACAAGNYLSGTTCGACQTSSGSSTPVTGCAVCDPAGGNICISCAPGMYNSGGTCITSTIPNCYSYSGTACTQCNPGYAPNANAITNCTTGTITNCSIYTYTASGTAATCAYCNPGYLLNSTTGNCSLCTSITTGTTCATCGPTTYLIPNASGCGQCPLGCMNCTSATTCTQCFPGSFLGQNGSCILGTPSDPNCAIANSSSVCVGCAAGYALPTPLNCTKSANLLTSTFALVSLVLYYLF